MKKLQRFWLFLSLVGSTITVIAQPVGPGDWSKIRRYGHSYDKDLYSPEELAYIDNNIYFLTLEKLHGRDAFEGMCLERATTTTAASLKNTKVLFYMQSYYAFNKAESVDNALTTNPEYFAPTEGQTDLCFNFDNAEARDWWVSVCDNMVNNNGIAGTFVDAIGKVNKYRPEWLPYVQQMMSQMDGLTIYNGDPDYIEYTDGFMRERFCAHSASENIEEIDNILKVPVDKYMLLNSTGNVDHQYSLAAFLIVANEYSFYRYTFEDADWSTIVWDCEEFDKPLGAPLGKALKTDLVYRRVYEHATVTLDLGNETSSIVWGQNNSRFEAEAATIVKGSITVDTSVSGGSYVDGNGNFNLTFAVNQSDAVSLAFAVQSPSELRAMGVYVNGVKIGTIGTDSNKWNVQIIDAVLNSGSNSIELRDSEGTKEFDVDYLEIIISDTTTLSNKSISLSPQSNPLVAPNPTTDSFQINSLDHVKEVQIFSTLGTLVKTFQNNQNSYSLNDLKPGLYLVKIITNSGETHVEKLIKE